MAGTRSSVLLVLTAVFILPSTLHAQVLGPFTMRLAPFCNVITFTAVAQGPIYNLSGFDDDCGAATRLSASGNAFFNPNGTVGGGLSIIAAGQPASQVAFTIDPGGPSGTWSDTSGNAGTLGFGVGAGAGLPRPVGLVVAGSCLPDSVRVGQACIDEHEASVWEVPAGSVALIGKIKAGTVTLAELQAGAVQRGTATDDYGAGCPDTGNGCVSVYAVSIAGVTPSRFITWFQAAAAARNAAKRLPANAEWQAAALGTPDGAPCVVSGGVLGATGTAGCVSNVGAFDMVGNLWEWVADWVPELTTCVPALFGTTSDANCLAGADTTGGPGALSRGGGFSSNTNAGVFAVDGQSAPSFTHTVVGFRAAR